MKHAAILGFLLLLWVSSLGFSDSECSSGMRDVTQREKDFYVSSLTAVRKAMPKAPGGWVIAYEKEILPSALGDRVCIDFTKLPMRIYFDIQYESENFQTRKESLQKAYEASYISSQKQQADSIKELYKRSDELSKAVGKAIERNDINEMEKLMKELDEVGKEMEAVSGKMEENAARDTEGLLLKDATASIRVNLNLEYAEVKPQGQPLKIPGAYYAVRTEGRRKGTAEWEEGVTTVLLGSWTMDGERSIRGILTNMPYTTVKTMEIFIQADSARADELLRQMDLKTLRALVQ
jgi:hypothetical protein